MPRIGSPVIEIATSNDGILAVCLCGSDSARDAVERLYIIREVTIVVETKTGRSITAVMNTLRSSGCPCVTCFSSAASESRICHV
jgi:hypothetical protein